MAKYECDFAEVYAAGEKLCQAAPDMNSAVGTYSSTIESDLSTWTGTAKTSFQSTNTTQVNAAKTDVAYINALGEFIKKSSQSIQSLEEQLAALSI